MNKAEFKGKYFTNNFYWVNENNYRQLQEIAINIGCLCFTGKQEIIDYHWSFKNLGFRTYPENNNITVFQREPFLLESEKATSYEKMLSDYKTLTH